MEEKKTELKMIKMSEVQSQEIEWLWYPFIPYGKLTIVQGDPGDGKTKGVEVFVYSTSSKAYAAAGRVCAKLAALGFTNRGVKISTGLYVLKHTKSPAMLIEVGFVDDKDDADLYNKVGVNAICKAIAEGILDKSVGQCRHQSQLQHQLLSQHQNRQLNRYHPIHTKTEAPTPLRQMLLEYVPEPEQTTGQKHIKNSPPMQERTPTAMATSRKEQE